MLKAHDSRERALRVRGRDSLSHETSKVGVEDSDILYRCYKSNVSIWSDDDDCTSITINPVCRISFSTGASGDGDVINENPKPLPSRQS